MPAGAVRRRTTMAMSSLVWSAGLARKIASQTSSADVALPRCWRRARSCSIESVSAVPGLSTRPSV